MNFTVEQAMLACGLDADQYEGIAREVFMDSFDTCKDLEDNDLTDAFKTLAQETLPLINTCLLCVQEVVL